MNQAAQRCGVSMLGDIQNTTEQEQPALADPSLSKGIGLDDSRGAFQLQILSDSMIVWFENLEQVIKAFNIPL